MSQVILHINEATLMWQALQTLISYGLTQNQAYEMAFAICKAARRGANLVETLDTTGGNDAE